MLVEALSKLSGTQDAAGDTILVFTEWAEWRKACAPLIRAARHKFEQHDNHRVILTPTRHHEHFRRHWWAKGAVGVVYFQDGIPISAYVYKEDGPKAVFNTIRLGRSLKSTTVRCALWDAGITIYRGEAPDLNTLKLIQRREALGGAGVAWDPMPNHPGKWIVTIICIDRPAEVVHDYGKATLA